MESKNEEDYSVCKGDIVKKNIGRISLVSKGNYRVITNSGENIGILKGSFFQNLGIDLKFPVVGDLVEFSYLDSDRVMIKSIVHRKNTLSRKVSGIEVEEQVIAANIDNIFICFSLNDDFNLSKIERYLFAFSSIPNTNLIIILTKKDLDENYRSKKEMIMNVYTDISIECISCFQNDYSALFKHIENGSISIFIGSSGVGKSTLLNYLFGNTVMKTQEINKKTDRGKHTTTVRQMFYINKTNSFIIDTPGMRELSIWSSDEGVESFSDIILLAKKCKFRNCSHEKEKDCAVKEAVLHGYIDEKRYKNYLKLIREQIYVERNKNYNSQMQNTERIKNKFK